MHFCAGAWYIPDGECFSKSSPQQINEGLDTLWWHTVSSSALNTALSLLGHLPLWLHHQRQGQQHHCQHCRSQSLGHTCQWHLEDESSEQTFTWQLHAQCYEKLRCIWWFLICIPVIGRSQSEPKPRTCWTPQWHPFLRRRTFAPRKQSLKGIRIGITCF